MIVRNNFAEAWHTISEASHLQHTNKSPFSNCLALVEMVFQLLLVLLQFRRTSPADPVKTLMFPILTIAAAKLRRKKDGVCADAFTIAREKGLLRSVASDVNTPLLARRSLKNTLSKVPLVVSMAITFEALFCGHCSTRELANVGSIDGSLELKTPVKLYKRLKTGAQWDRPIVCPPARALRPLWVSMSGTQKTDYLCLDWIPQNANASLRYDPSFS